MASINRLNCICFLLVATLADGHEPPTEHMNREVSMWVLGNELFIRYAVDVPERAAMMQLLAVDRDHDGKITPAERDAFYQSQADVLATQLHFRLGKSTINVSVVKPPSFAPPMQQIYHFKAQLGKLPAGIHRLEHEDLSTLQYSGFYRYYHAPPVDVAGAIPVALVTAPKTASKHDHPRLIKLVLEFTVE